MKKENIYKFLYLVSILLIIGFIIRLGADYLTYKASSSAPFYAFIIVRSLEFILPSVIIFIIGTILKKKMVKK